jgi:hypothetical protein
MAGVTLSRDFDINRKLANLSVRVEYLERRLAHLEARGQYQDYTPTITNLSATVDFARWSRMGNVVQVWASFSVTGAATGTIEIGTPVNIAEAATFRPSGTAVARASGATGLNVHKALTVTRATGNTLSFLTTSATSGLAWNATTPFTWSNTAILRFQATYEAEV